VTALAPVGLVDDFPEDAYHSHPALSASAAKKLLAPSCPALFKHEREHGQQHRQAFDIGHAAHKAVLGVGAELEVIDAPDWKTKAAREARDEAYAAGKVPLLTSEAAQVAEMHAAVFDNHEAAALFMDGKPEQSAFWTDWTTGIDRRARLDWLTLHDDGTATVVDLKTTTSAEPGAFAKSVFTYGYDIQQAYYTDAVHALGLANRVRFVFIAVEKTAPHLVGVYELDARAEAIGRQRVDEALAIYARCTATDTWPGYGDGVQLIGPPNWVARQYEGSMR
jgi:hypothetical protein